MNIEIECADCGHWGELLMEGEGGYVRHPEGAANCGLPPRDILHPQTQLGRPRRWPAPPRELAGWIAS